MFFRLALLTIAYCTLTTLLQAQTIVSGRITATDGKPVAQANVLLLRASDSVLVKGTSTNDEGGFLLENIAKGLYLLRCSHAAFADTITAPFAVELKKENTIFLSLKPAEARLGNVTVVAKRKPLYEQQIDRMVVNVKSSPTNAGNTVLEVLEKSPGIMVNRSSGQVSMQGKDGVQIMINGKINYMPTDAVLQLLGGINASLVERIELITIPPAKYDAGGNAGYINIVMAANPNEGFNGNYTLGMGVGNGTAPNASAGFNYRKRTFNLFGTYTYRRTAQLQELSSYRKVEQGNTMKETYAHTDRDPYQRNHNLQLGADWNVSKKTVIGILATGYNNKWYMTAENKAGYFTNGKPDTLLTVANEETNQWKHLAGNLNLQHTLREGEVFSANADYLVYSNTNPTQYINQYYTGSGQPLAAVQTFSGKETNISMWVAQADYEKKTKDGATFQAGAKMVGQHFTNDVLVANLVQDVWVPDPLFTANYYLDEQITAAYGSAEKQFGPKTSFKAGLRYEYTQSNLGSESQKNIVDRKYGNLFPTLYLSRHVQEDQTLTFSYNRRIDRPSFNVLAPFLIFFDPKTFVSGNPAVQPAITDAVEAGYTLKRLGFKASYAYINNVIARFVPQTDPATNKQIIMSQNLDYSQLATISVSMVTPVTPWWQSNLNISGTWNKVKGIVNNEMTVFSQAYFSLNGSEIIMLPKRLSFEVSGNFTSRSLQPAFFGAAAVEPFGQLNLALQKKLGRQGNTLTLGADNVLNTFKWSTSLSAPGQGIETNSVVDFFPPLYKITWNQRLGNNTLREKRQRATGADDIKRVE